jgi:hypothetical protein
MSLSIADDEVKVVRTVALREIRWIRICLGATEISPAESEHANERNAILSFIQCHPYPAE